MIRHTLDIDALAVDTFTTTPGTYTSRLVPPTLDTWGDCCGGSDAMMMMPHSAHTHVCDPCCNQ